jgi:hypothetical protein
MASLCQTLPEELLNEIALELSASHSLGTLASLNATCQHIHLATLPAFYRKLILFKREPGGVKQRAVPVLLEDKDWGRILETWRHVR